VGRENVEVLRGLVDAFNRREIAPTAAALDEFVVWDARQIPVPDLQAVFIGLEGAADFWSRWLPMWERVTSEIVWIDAVGDRVLMWLNQSQVGRESGAEVTVRYGWDVTFRNEKVIRVSFFNDEEAARRDADLGVT
jgi:ketosteroid isomerase-like protein